MGNDQVTAQETAEILRLARQGLEVEGDFVELGCYRGDTSVLLGKLLVESASPFVNCGKPVENLRKSSQKMCKNHSNQCKTNEKLCKTSFDLVENLCKNSMSAVENTCKNAEISRDYSNFALKKLWLYDSFAGLPEKSLADQSGAGQSFQKGELLVTKRAVVEKMRRHGLKNVIVKKAWFADLTDVDLPPQVAFAFLDGDLYESIKVSLQLVAPRLTKRGIIVVHDYNNPELPGASRAVEEFLRTRPCFRFQQKHSLAILQEKCP